MPSLAQPIQGTAGTLAAPGTELAGWVGSRCVVPAGLGALLELLFAGIQARTVGDGHCELRDVLHDSRLSAALSPPRPSSLMPLSRSM